MRVAFVGKGGSGKSAIAGTFARALARRGQPVLVLDSDPLPGLAWSLGIPPTDAGIPDEATQEGEEGGPAYRLRDGLSPTEAADRYAAHGPDGVRVLQYGKPRGHIGGLRRSQHAFSDITHGVDDSRWHLVGDLPAGTRQPFMGWTHYADTLLVVVEPSAKSIMAARRLARMSDPTGRRPGAHTPAVRCVANKVTDPTEVEEIRRRTGLEVVAEVPVDPAFAAAERNGMAPIDAVPDSPAVVAVGSLAERMLEQDARTRAGVTEEGTP